MEQDNYPSFSPVFARSNLYRTLRARYRFDYFAVIITSLITVAFIVAVYINVLPY